MQFSYDERLCVQHLLLKNKTCIRALMIVQNCEGISDLFEHVIDGLNQSFAAAAAAAKADDVIVVRKGSVASAWKPAVSITAAVTSTSFPIAAFSAAIKSGSPLKSSSGRIYLFHVRRTYPKRESRERRTEIKREREGGKVSGCTHR